MHKWIQYQILGLCWLITGKMFHSEDVAGFDLLGYWAVGITGGFWLLLGTIEGLMCAVSKIKEVT